MKILAISCTLLLWLPAHASEGIFGYIRTLDNTPEGGWEYEQIQTYRTGKARGTYRAVDLRNAFEYGITNDFQVSFYLNSAYVFSRDVIDPDDFSRNRPDVDGFELNGTAIEFVYRVLSPYKDSIGLGLYLEPEMSIRDERTGEDEIERAVEARILLQKHFLGDTLITAANIMVEPEWVKENGLHTKELYVEFTLGANYRLRDNWFAGFEFRNHMEFPDMNLRKQEHSAFFFGPNLHFANQKYWWTVTVLPQLWGFPTYLGTDAQGNPVGHSSLHLAEHEKLEVRVMVGIPLGSEGHSHE